MSTCVATSIDAALLGCGNVGGALARLAERSATAGFHLNIAQALVRDPARPRELPRGRLTFHAESILAGNPDVVIELLGGTDPARRLVLDALRRGIPVVTANKTLLARHGGELRQAAAETGTALLYEAAVLAGVPFLGTFARRPNAASATSLVGIVNGTSNFILTRCAADGGDVARALTDAQRWGYAEPDPRNDTSGVDACEKLAVLLQHFAAREVDPDTLETSGIDAIAPGQLDHARELDGVIKPVVFADWTSGLEAFVGPAFVPARHVLARVDGVDNALLLGGRHGHLLFQGPGAGPEVTAAAVLDDVHEIVAGSARCPHAPLRRGRASAPATEWMITIEGDRLPRPADVSDLLAAYDIYPHRLTPRDRRCGRERQSLIVFPIDRKRVDEGLRALHDATGCSTAALRALEVLT